MANAVHKGHQAGRFVAWLAERSVVDRDPLSHEAARDWAVRDSPIEYGHIRPYGRYQFNTITPPDQLPPVSDPANQPRRGAPHRANRV